MIALVHVDNVALEIDECLLKKNCAVWAPTLAAATHLELIDLGVMHDVVRLTPSFVDHRDPIFAHLAFEEAKFSLPKEKLSVCRRQDRQNQTLTFRRSGEYRERTFVEMS